MKRQHLGTLISSVLTLGIIIWLVSQKKGFWWYIGTFLIISPLGYSIGYSLGKDDPEEIKKQQEQLKQENIEADRARKCKDAGGIYSQGVCKKFTVDGMKPIKI